jgi:hypothetical protein
MKLVVIKPEVDKFDQAKQLLERELTPKERTWLILADVLLRKDKKTHLTGKMEFVEAA